jgi:aminoglycoside 3-N-acetyltransferase
MGVRPPGEAMRIAARRLPRPLRERMRDVRRTYRSARYRGRERLRPTRLSGADVEHALREAGLREGDSMFMQAAMSAFGSFERGPDSVIEGIERVVGPQGLIAMAAFPMSELAIEYLARDPVFDVRETPSRMGAISERFRRTAEAWRSIHPTHSVAARGPEAEEIVAGHETATTPLGEGTPFPRLIERDALQVFFGSGTGAITMYHSFECTREPPFPLDVFADRRFDARCVGREGEELIVRTLVHNPTLQPGRIDTNRALQSRFRTSLLERAGARAVTLGRGEVLTVRLQSMLEEFDRLLDEGITMYDVPVPDEQPSVPPQARVGA